MAWIKRNILFLVGSLLALGLLGGAGFYLFTRNQANNDLKEKVTAAYGEAESVSHTSPGPGNDKVDNIKAAKDQVVQMRDILAKQHSYFRPIAPIPAFAEGTNAISDHEFASALRDTINELQHDAASSSVQLPPRYDFSFSAIKSKITFAPDSLTPLAQQLGEVKAICDVIFRARVNSLDSIRRVKVSLDDKEAPDYLEVLPVTNDLAVIEPYEIIFRSFSGELAGVLDGFAKSPNGFRIKTTLVDPSSAMTTAPGADAAAYVAPTAPAPVARVGGEDEGAARPAAVAAYVPTASTARGGLPTVINEHPIKVTLMLELVKLKTPAK
ncbi:MAG: hypothetical protein RLZZ350_2191 [Verrucomicrobiota bacterium]|jgi:hypothetical protein